MRCRGWPQEAALLMLENNLHPDVAERPEELVVYGGIGKAARNHGVRSRRSSASCTRLGGDETLLVQSGKPVGGVRDPPGRAARADRQLQPRAAVGDVGARSASSTPPG